MGDLQVSSGLPELITPQRDSDLVRGQCEDAGLAPRRVAALAVAGAPMTSGMVAKDALKTLVTWSPGPWANALEWLLPVTAVGTTLLLGRFLLRAVAHPGTATHAPLSAGLWLPWVALLLGVGGALWVLPRHHALDLDPPAVPDAATLWVSTWPVLLGTLLLGTALLVARRRGIEMRRFAVAPGDLLVPVEHALGSVDDSDGHLGDILRRLQDIHLDACKKAKPDPDALARRLFDWELRTDWNTFFGAADTDAAVLGKLGEFGQPIIRKSADRIVQQFAENIARALEARPAARGRRIKPARASRCSISWRYTIRASSGASWVSRPIPCPSPWP